LTVLRIVDRHVLKQIATPLVAAMSIGLLMLLAERMVRLLDTTLGKKNSFGVVFELLAYLVPHYLGTAIPAALFLGLLFGFSRMSANAETDAFMSAGISLHRLARPVIVLALALSAASLVIIGWAQPYTRYAYRAVVFDVQNVEFFYLAEEGVFMQSGGRTFILDTLNRSTNAFDHVFIYEDTGVTGTQTVTATRGQLIEVPGSPRPNLHLEHGHRLQFKQQPSYESPTVIHPDISEFSEADTPLGKGAKELFRPRGEDERELTLPELFAQLSAPPKGTTRAAMLSEINKRLMYVVSPMVLPFLALPFAVGGRRKQRAYRFGFALVLLVAFHEIVEQGSLASHSGKVPAWMVTWLPFALLALFAGWRYRATCFTVDRDPLDTAIDRVGEATSALRDRLFRRLGFDVQS
jgi:lipopolysaccharide export system permease protein